MEPILADAPFWCLYLKLCRINAFQVPFRRVIDIYVHIIYIYKKYQSHDRQTMHYIKLLILQKRICRHML